MSEYDEQKIVIKWFRDTYPDMKRSIRLSLNGIPKGGGKSGRIRNSMARTQGMVDAESDLFFAMPNGNYHGIFIEMKDWGKKPTSEQSDYLTYQTSMGYMACWCEGAQEAINVIKEYLK